MTIGHFYVILLYFPFRMGSGFRWWLSWLKCVKVLCTEQVFLWVKAWQQLDTEQ